MTSLTTAPATCSLGLALLAVLAAPAEASPPKPLTRDKLPKITGIELNVRVDTAYPCYLSVNASFSPSESGTIWYRFLGPSGVTFDMGPEGTMDVQGGPHSGAGVGKGAKMRPVIRGAFKVEVAYVRSNGKHGASTFSKDVRAHYTCGDGTAVAVLVPAPGQAPSKAEATQPALPSQAETSATPATDNRSTESAAAAKPLPPKFAGGPYATKSKVLVKSNDKVLPLKREEQIAYIFLQSMSNMEDDCGRDAAEPCTFEALLRGPKLKKDGWEVGRLAFDPNTADPNYSYKLTLSEGSWEIWANPRRPGVGGFYLKQKWGGGVWYNPAGPADRSHTLIDGGSIDGDLFVIK